MGRVVVPAGALGLPGALAACVAAGVAVSLAACGPPSAGEGSGAEGGADGAAPAAERSANAARVPDTPAGALLARSLAHHDPTGLWSRGPIRLRWVSSRPGAEDRVAALTIDNSTGRFELEMEYRGAALEYRVRGDSVAARVDGAAEVPAELRQRLSLDREDGLFWRNYFLFLAGLPMKLTDPGAVLAESPADTRFQGRDVRAIRVTYEGDDRFPNWEFYFDPDSAALVGARFWNQGREVDGEYLVMEGSARADAPDGSLRIPATRRWYMNADDEYLGADEVRDIAVGGGAEGG